MAATKGCIFSVGCSVVGNDEVGAFAKLIDDALDVFGGLSVLEIDMKWCISPLVFNCVLFNKAS